MNTNDHARPPRPVITEALPGNVSAFASNVEGGKSSPEFMPASNVNYFGLSHSRPHVQQIRIIALVTTGFHPAALLFHMAIDKSGHPLVASDLSHRQPEAAIRGSHL